MRRSHLAVVIHHGGPALHREFHVRLSRADPYFARQYVLEGF